MVGFEWLDFTPTERISRSERTLDEARFWPMVLHLNLTSYGWLLRGRAAAKSLSGCGRLYHRRGIYYSNRFRRKEFRPRQRPPERIGTAILSSSSQPGR